MLQTHMNSLDAFRMEKNKNKKLNNASSLSATVRMPVLFQTLSTQNDATDENVDREVETEHIPKRIVLKKQRTSDLNEESSAAH